MKKLIFLLILGLFISENRVFAQSFHNYYIAGIEVSGDGSRFAITGRQVTSEGQIVFPVDIYDSGTYEIVASVPLRAIPTSFGLNRDGTKLGYVFPMTEFGIIDLETMAFVSQEGTTMIEYEDLAWSPIYNDVYAYGLGSAVFVAESSDFPGGYHQSNSRIVGISWTIEGNLIGSQYNLTTREMSLALWEPNSTEPIVTLSNYGGGSHLALSLANGLVAVEGLNGISIFDGNLSFVNNLDDMSYSLAWSPDGTKLAIASGDSLNIWDVGTGTLVQTFETNTLNVIWLPNGDLIHDGDEPGLYQNGIWVQELVPPIACDLTTPSSDTTALLSAIAAANGTPEADTICLEAGTYTLTTSNNSASDGPNGLPVITSDITLHGLGAGATITRDSAAPAFRILKVDTGARLVLENITISGGDAGSGSGGGIRNLGMLELRNSVVENNLPDDLSGEGVIIQAER